MDESLLQRFAELTVDVGANVQPGQVVAVSADPAAAPLVHAIAARCYERGAKFVDVAYFDAQAKRIRLEHADPESLDYVPPWHGERLLALGRERAARIVLYPVVPPGLLDGIDPALAARDQLPALKELFSVINDRSTNWSIVPYATPEWAAAAHPELDADAALARLWEEVVHVCRLDEPDPAAAWNERFETLESVAKRLTERRFDAIHFEGDGTDLTVGLLPGSLWMAAHMVTAEGIVHAPNIPTEETSTAPDPQRVDGIVRATKPLDLAGTVVRGLRVRFEGGRAVEIDADENAAALRGRCDLDDGASRLGEVALVDGQSRIGRLGTVFSNTLLDENAASHLAFGNAYAISAEESEREHINTSQIHVDFMIGGNDVDVTGIERGDGRVPLLRGGDWQI